MEVSANWCMLRGGRVQDAEMSGSFEFPNRRHKGKPVPWHELFEFELMFRHRRAG